MSELVERLGNRIRYLRKQRGLSQDKLGEAAGLHVNYIGQVERGEKNITIETLEKVSRGLGISLEELFRYLDPMKNKDETGELVELLESRPQKDKVLALTLVKSVFKWEQQKYR